MVGLSTAKAHRAGARPAADRREPSRGPRPLARASPDDVPFPYLLLLVSGGHCQFVFVEGVGKYRRLGSTIDDAAGEAFDKTAKLLGLSGAGGPAGGARGIERQRTAPSTCRARCSTAPAST